MQRLSFTTRLRQAVEREHWVLHYQPIVDLQTGDDRVGVEALVRWHDPNGGLVPPGEFIPLAEELGLIEAIGDWVIAELARQRAEWARRRPRSAGRVQPVAAPAVVGAPGGARCSAKLAMRRTSTRATSIVEITESTAMADPDRTQQILAELHAWGSRWRSTTSGPATRRSRG